MIGTIPVHRDEFSHPGGIPVGRDLRSCPMPAARSSRPPRLLAGLALALTVVAFPLGTLASHDFADVPDSNPFHADISALAASGVTTGCGGGNYCPSAFVTREQMAAFMNRLGALAPGKTPVVNADELDGLDSGQFARSDAAHRFRCYGTDMAPLVASDAYITAAVSGFLERFLVSGDGYFSCNVNLPDNALITSFSGVIFDESASAHGFCELRRMALDGSGTGLVAQTSTSGTVDVPGYTTLVDPTIASPIVDPSFAYSARCYLSGAGVDLRIVSIGVDYVG